MAQTVSNDALWEKLSEIDKKLEKAVKQQKNNTSIPEHTEDKADLVTMKEDIIRQIKQHAKILGTHSDINFDAYKQYFQSLEERVLNSLKVIHLTIKEQKESPQPQIESRGNYFDFRFFKIRKTSLIIAILSLLIFILTLFCMKQQNDYSLLMNEYCKQEKCI